jgi:septal ring factor EnvC (AmiA/AmiB activator)
LVGDKEETKKEIKWVKKEIQENMADNRDKLESIESQIEQMEEGLTGTIESLGSLRNKEVPQMIRDTRKDLSNDMGAMHYMNSLLVKAQDSVYRKEAVQRNKTLSKQIEDVERKSRNGIKKINQINKKNRKINEETLEKMQKEIDRVGSGKDRNTDKIEEIGGRLEQMQGAEQNEREVLASNISNMETDFRKLEEKIDGNFETCEKKLRNLKRHLNGVDAAVYEQTLIASAQDYLQKEASQG